MLESFEKVKLLTKIREKRPVVPIKDHAKEWWQYAGSMIRKDVHRRQLMWSWSYIKKSRTNIKEKYKETYVKKLAGQKITKKNQETIDDCEKVLNGLSIFLMRQLAAIKASRLEKAHDTCSRPSGDNVTQDELKEEEYIKMKTTQTYSINRPTVPLKYYAKHRWRFAITSILDDIHRRQRMRSWSYITNHRTLMKRYLEAYVKKMDGKKTSTDLQNTIDDCEKNLSVFSIIVVRQLAEEEAVKLKKAHNKKIEEIKKTVEEQLQLDRKLAIPYEVIAVRVDAKFKKMTFTLKYEQSRDHIIKFVLKDVSGSLQQKPSAKSISIEAKVKTYTVQGTPQNGHIPDIVLSQTNETYNGNPLLDVLVETNPFGQACDTSLRVKLKTSHLEFIYDAVTVNNLVGFAKPPDNVNLQELTQTAVSTIETIIEHSTTRLSQIMDKKKYIELSVDIQPSYVIIPTNGSYTKDSKILIIDLGNLKLRSEKREYSSLQIQQIHEEKEQMKVAYDKFYITLDRLQILFSSSGEEWRVLRKLPKSSMHILEPIEIKLVLHKCIYDKDMRLTMMKMSGELPLLNLKMSDHQVYDLIELAHSIPMPDSAILPTKEHVLARSIKKTLKKKSVATEESMRTMRSKKFPNYTKMEIKFEIKQVDVNISQVVNRRITQVVRLEINSLGTEIAIHTYDIDVSAYLGGLYLQYISRGYLTRRTTPEVDYVVNLVNTPDEDGSKHLLQIHYIKTNIDGPHFATTYKKIEQKLDVTFSSLQVLLHQEALLHVLELIEKLKPTSKKRKDIVTLTTELAKDKKKTDEKKDKEKKTVKNKKRGTGSIVIEVKLRKIQLGLCTKQKRIADARITGIYCGVMIESGIMKMEGSMATISILNPSDDQYSRIMIIEEGCEILNARCEIYDDATRGEKYSVLTNVGARVEIHIGCIKLIFVNTFFNDILDFLNKFVDTYTQLNNAKKITAEYSKDVARKLQEKMPRVSLILEMKAPVIIIPQNAKSTNVLVADFGSLSIRNHFIKAGESRHKIPFVLDKIVMELTSMKISRGIIGDNLALLNESLILEPITVEILITRNLSAAIFTEVPNIGITGVMKSVSVKLSEEDYIQIIATSNENYIEGHVPDSNSTVLDESKEQKRNQMSNDFPPLSRRTTANMTCKLKINFEIESLSCSLYVGKTDLMAQRADKAALSKIEVQSLAVCGMRMSDKSMKLKATMKDIVLDDSRPHKSDGITRMIQRRKCNASDKESDTMIEISFNQDCYNDSSVDVKIRSLYICVCLDYLISMGNFASKGIPKEKQRKVNKKQTKQVKSKMKDKLGKQSLPSTCMTIVGKIEKPEIILIEDQLNSNCNCLVLNTEIVFDMKIHPQSQNMSFSANDLQIFSCVFSNRGAVAAQILNTCELFLESEQHFGRNTNMRIQTSELIFNISPATIKTISGICTAFAKKPEPIKETCTYTDLWEVNQLSDSDFGFLKLDIDYKEEQEIWLAEAAEDESRLEQLIAMIPLIVIQMEGGIGQRTVPLLIVESSISVDVKNWSSKLSIGGKLQIEVAYYNEKLSVWEPLLEPVVEDGKIKRWELKLEVKINEGLLAPSKQELSSFAKILLPPKMTVNVFSPVDMQLTLSRTCLEVLHNLQKAFGDAYMLVEPSQKAGEMPYPFIIKNQTGLEVEVTLDNSFVMPKDSYDSKVKMTHKEPLKLWNKKNSRKTSSIKKAQEGDEKKLIFQIEGFSATRKVSIKRAEKRLYQIYSKKHLDEVFSCIVKTETPMGQKIVSIQSIIQIKNHFKIPIEVYYVGDNIGFCGVVDPGTYFSVPLTAVNTRKVEFQFTPDSKNFQRSQSVKWKDAENFENVQLLKCEESYGHSSFYMSVKVKVKNVYFEFSDSLSAKSYTVHLSPTYILHNLLPYTVEVELEHQNERPKRDIATTLKRGENKALNTFGDKSYINIAIPMYDSKKWIGKKIIKRNLPEQSIIVFQSEKYTLNLGLHCQSNNECMDISVYSPYWMVNHTGQDLYYKTNDSVTCVKHEHGNDDIVMFSVKEKALFSSEKKASIQMTDSEWSNKFCLDKEIRDKISIRCTRNKKQTFSVGYEIICSGNGLTMICTITPFYVLTNTSKFVVMCQEITQGGDNWIAVPSNECMAFWPIQSGKDLAMKAKISGSDVETIQFHFSETHTTLLKLSTKYGGMNVDCQVAKSATVVTFSEYSEGMATVLLVNHTEKEMIQFHQSGVDSKNELNAKQYLLYTWEHSTRPREIVWTCGGKPSQKNDFKQDGKGEISVNATSTVYWVSFVYGMQRILLFTDNNFLAWITHETGGEQRIELEINICIRGLGLSLVNDYKQKEIAYLGITSPGILWEEMRQKVTACNEETRNILERGYREYVRDLSAGHTPQSKVRLRQGIEVDWKEMMMIKPNECPIRRCFPEGIMLQFKLSPQQIEIHTEIQRLQLDNQMSDAIFQTVVARTPLAKSLVTGISMVPSPFIEFSMITRKSKHSKIVQFKYCKVSAQQMTLNVDLRLINEILELWPTAESFVQDPKIILLEKDYKATKIAFKNESRWLLGQKNLYNYLCLSPIEVHLSVSNQGCGGKGIQRHISSDTIKTLLKFFDMINVDVQNVVIKYSQLEINQVFFNVLNLKKAFAKHYKPGLYKQIIRAAVGDGIAAITFDDDYKMIRRHVNSHQHANIISRLGGSVSMGIVFGLGGVLRKPIQGAMKDGFSGLLTGIGKGIVGVVTTPVSGIVDFVSGSFEGSMRVPDMSAEIRRLRNPRMFHIDKIIRPFNPQEEACCMILKLTKEGIFALTDLYVAHALIRGDGHVLIVTDKRVIHATCLPNSDRWDAAWSFTWEEIEETHTISHNIEIVLKDKRLLRLQGFMNIRMITNTKIVNINLADAETADYIHGKIEQLLKTDII